MCSYTLCPGKVKDVCELADDVATKSVRTTVCKLICRPNNLSNLREGEEKR